MAEENKTPEELLARQASLRASGLNEEALAAGDEILKRFGDIPSIAAAANFNKAIALSALGQWREEVALYDDIAARFADASELNERLYAAKAMFNKALTLSKFDQEREIEAYDALIDRFEHAPEAQLREAVARALVNLAVALGTPTPNEVSISVYSDVIARYRGAPEQPLCEQVARAWYGKAVTLAGLSRFGDSQEALDAMIAYLENLKTPLPGKWLDDAREALTAIAQAAEMSLKKD